MKRRSFEEKRQWILKRFADQFAYSCRVYNPPQRPWISASDEDEQQAWEKEFGGKVVYYTMGPNVSPDFARTLRRMYIAGELVRSTGGNQDARRYNQKTYYISYSLRNDPSKSYVQSDRKEAAGGE